jgi:hypothetical protein
MNFPHNPPAPETFIPDALDSITETSMYASGITPTVEYRSGYSDPQHQYQHQHENGQSGPSDQSDQNDPGLMQGKLYAGTGHCCVHGCTEPSHLYFAGSPQDGMFYGVKESCASRTWAGVPPPTEGAPDESILRWYALDGDSCTTNAPVVDETGNTMEWQQGPSGAFQMDTVPGKDILASLEAPVETLGPLEPLEAHMQANTDSATNTTSTTNTINTINTAHTWQHIPEEVTFQEALSAAAATYVPLQPVPPASMPTYKYRQGQIAYLANKIVELNSWTPSSRSLKRASTCPTLDEEVSTSVSLRQSQTWPAGTAQPAETQPTLPGTGAAGSTDVVPTHRPAPYHDESGPSESQL